MSKCRECVNVESSYLKEVQNSSTPSPSPLGAPFVLYQCRNMSKHYMEDSPEKESGNANIIDYKSILEKANSGEDVAKSPLMATQNKLICLAYSEIVRTLGAKGEAIEKLRICMGNEKDAFLIDSILQYVNTLLCNPEMIGIAASKNLSPVFSR